MTNRVLVNLKDGGIALVRNLTVRLKQACQTESVLSLDENEDNGPVLAVK